MLYFIVLSAFIAISGASPPNNATTPAAGEANHLAPPFEINIGCNPSTGNMVAWIAGQSKCTNAVLGPCNTNWCGRRFNLGGASGLTAEGCGGPLWVNQNGKFFANCGGFSEKDACGIKTQYHCS